MYDTSDPLTLENDHGKKHIIVQFITLMSQKKKNLDKFVVYV